MALIDRLAGIGDPETNGKLSVLSFWAHLYEMSQGFRTKEQIISSFALDPAEKTELQWIIDRYNAQPNAGAKARFVDLMMVLFILAEEKVPGYSTNADLVARINAIV